MCGKCKTESPYESTTRAVTLHVDERGQERKAMNCAECQKLIPEGRHVCAWDNSSGRVMVRFICEECAAMLEKEEEEEMD